jgi:hypothetical protein
MFPAYHGIKPAVYSLHASNRDAPRMMSGLSGIYGREFFAEWGSTNREYVETAGQIVRVLYGQFLPKRVIDVGSGCGVFSDLFRKAGSEVVSLDGVEPPAEFSFPGNVEIRDLTEPFANEWGEFDLTLCLEVAEHIPEELSATFLRNIAQFGGHLVMSAARPGQGGTHHVNEQPRGYWHERLAPLGLAYSRKKTGLFQEAFKAGKPPLMWMGHHVDIYERSGG